jgi:ubiquinone/menaquinone biosynthesis C-methylase UbiE
LKQPISYALDVGCGTGQSTKALRSIADHVIGTEISAEMLLQATPALQLQYLATPAEQLPFRNSSVEIITVSLAFHWFKRSQFLAEASRLLVPAGWLILYNNGFLGRMVEQSGFEAWFRERYLIRYPTPPRHSQPLTEEEVEQYSLKLVEEEKFINEIDFSVEGLAHYLMTQSNITAVVEAGAESIEDAYRWLVGTLSPMFKQETGRFRFGTTMLYLCKLKR